jgi:hypothetical protein
MKSIISVLTENELWNQLARGIDLDHIEEADKIRAELVKRGEITE